ncbi:Predicted ATPase of the PP-loop superfamily implicated in cell cycle control [Chryseobacterium taklimakanense]|uniref:Predicted ATPase of the PP-loop superfamily implicated in cell cycle control n=1 Tax=Chryseobacterium taklimakanense TaxID=536441 RepID=A0A239X8T5_9FLAO|nr:N-acetyl sugar amidotransferase [Chryseobacterium taklimakanense]SNV42424.1 Predicted ATPase of the PP-loop superfamily implicated in cell cycle control [Chryseobacterium taklimakanense]
MKPKNKPIQICTNCIMDSTDETIQFDENGRCDYCANYYNNILPNWNNSEADEVKILPVLEKIKKEGKNKDHDCIIGISGGLDSSYLVHLAVTKWGMRPLLYHVDAGWNSDVSTHNIRCLVDKLGLDLYTDVINWEEMKDLQRAFFKSQVPDIDTPQDLVFFSSLYNYCAKNKIKYILTGGNFSTECVREPLHWGAYYQTDMKYVNDIHSKFGTRKLKTFPTCDIFKYKIQYRFVNGIRVVKPLDHTRFIKKEAEDLLEKEYGWQRYKHKHHESRFTRWFEAFWLREKFGFDKRKNHLSSLVLTGQMSREDALKRVSEPELPADELKSETEYVAKKLGFRMDELMGYFNGPNKTFHDYKNNYKLIQAGTKVMQMLGLEKRSFK